MVKKYLGIRQAFFLIVTGLYGAFLCQNKVELKNYFVCLKSDLKAAAIYSMIPLCGFVLFAFSWVEFHTSGKFADFKICMMALFN